MPFMSQKDVRELLENPDDAVRERTVAKIAEIFHSRTLDGRAAMLVDEIIRIFAHDAAVRVRKALAEQLKHDPDLPPDAALSLARDVDDVAVPILRFSRALSDEDLAAIASSEGQEKLRAIASRMTVGESLCETLIERGDADTVAALFANAGSQPSEESMLRAVDRFGEDDRVQTPLANRSELPQTVIARMVAVVSTHVLNELSARKDLPADLARDIIEQAEERAFLTLSREAGDPEALAKRLQEIGRLTPNLVMRALIGGELGFFEAATCRLAGLKPNAMRTLAYDAGALGAQELCRRMGAPERSASVIEAGLAALASLRAEDSAFDVQRLQARMIERVLSRFDELAPDMESSDVEALIGRLRFAG